MTRTVAFPGLGLEFHLNRVAFEIFGLPIYWYGVIIAAGFLLAVTFCCRISRRFGIRSDDVIDLLFFAVPLSIVGARLYYIVFYLDLFRDTDGSLSLAKMVDIRNGGLAIYGGVLAAAATLLIFCRVKRLNFFAFADMGVFGLLIGQCVGRWGNFVNVEAFGGPCGLPWRMGIDVQTATGAWEYMEVHPTFLYESLWNFLGFILLLTILAAGRRKFDGQMMWSYFLWYGIGRGFIEGLRTDSLYLFGTIRVSQALGFASALVAAGFLFYHLVIHKHSPQELYVNRIKMRPEQEANYEEEETKDGGEHN